MTQENDNTQEMTLEQQIKNMTPQEMVAAAFFKLMAQHQNWDAMIEVLTSWISNASSDKSRATHYLLRGLVYFQKSEFDSAVGDFSRAAEITPDMLEAYFYRGAAYLKKGEEARAQSDLKRAHELGPDGKKIIELLRLMKD